MMAIGNDGFAAPEYNFTCSPSCLLFEKKAQVFGRVNKGMIDRVGDIKCLFCLPVCSRATCKCHAIYHVTFLSQPTIYKWTVVD